MKKCPYCAEDVQEDAKKCKHCGEWFATDLQPQVENPELPVSTAAKSALPVSEEQEKVVYLLFDSKTLIAWAVTALYLFGFWVKQVHGLQVPPEVFWLALGLLTFNAGLSIQLIRLFRGSNRNWRDRSIGGEKLSAWGYIWRSVIANFFGGLTVYFFENILSLNRSMVEPSVANLLLWAAPCAVAITFASWLLFSRDRRGQLQVALLGIRGY